MLPHLSLSLQFCALVNPALHRAALPRHAVQRWIRHSLERDAEITVRIVDTAEAQQLNRDYRHKDYATNVLTFDYQSEPLICADLVLCAPVVADEAAAQGKTLQAHYAHLIIHGTLHAQGWDHETSTEDAEAMEAREIAIMAKLGWPSPY
jgi:probable rRNA maturation factor